MTKSIYYLNVVIKKTHQLGIPRNACLINQQLMNRMHNKVIENIEIEYEYHSALSIDCDAIHSSENSLLFSVYLIQ